MLLARYTKWNRPCMVFWARFWLQGTKVGNDAIDMEVNKGLLPFEWRRLVDTIQGIIDDPRRRLQRLKVLRDVQLEVSLAERNKRKDLAGGCTPPDARVRTWQERLYRPSVGQLDTADKVRLRRRHLKLPSPPKVS